MTSRTGTIARSIFLGLLILAGSINIVRAEGRNLEIAVGEWPPYLSEDLPKGGVMAEIISEIFRETNTPISFRFLPWARAYQEAASGNHQATGVWMHKDEREKDFIYSDPVLTEQFVFFHRTNTDFDWKTLADIEPWQVGGGIKYSYGPAFDAAIKAGKIRIERVGDVHLNLKKLIHGRIDLFPQEINVGYADSRKHLSPDEQNRLTHHPKPFLNNHSYLLFPRSRQNSRHIVQRFNDALRLYRESGRYEAMLLRHKLLRVKQL